MTSSSRHGPSPARGATRASISTIASSTRGRCRFRSRIRRSGFPGLLSPETVVWCAQHRYPYIALATFLEPTVELWNIYRDAAAKEGYQVGPENFGYLQKVYVAETDEKAREIAKWDMFGGAGIGYSACSASRSGCSRRDTTRRKRRGASRKQFSDPRRIRAGVRRRVLGATPPRTKSRRRKSKCAPACGSKNRRSTSRRRASRFSTRSRKVEKSMQVICGTPKTVSRKSARCSKCCVPAFSASGRTTARSPRRIASTTCGSSPTRCCRRCARWARSSS